MPSFFEKLKKGMGIEESKFSSPPLVSSQEEVFKEDKIETPVEELTEKETDKKQKKIKKSRREKKVPELKIKKLEIQTKQPEEKIEKEKTEVKEEKNLPSFGKIEESGPSSLSISAQENKSSFPFAFAREGEEGQLAIDVYQTEDSLVIQSAIAGVNPENLDISLERDIITIKGIREKSPEESSDYFTQECFWGSFSREIIAPIEIDPSRAVAEMKNGILTIRIPKISRERKRKISVSA